MFSKNQFPVQGRLVVITGGSRGLGLSTGRQLAEKGASIVIVARGQERLAQAIEHIRQGAPNPETQRFHYISADLTSSSEAVRVIDEVISWNSGSPPDIVWCCAGSAHPALFIDTPVSEFGVQMNNNYFTSLYVAHAVLTHWLKPPSAQKEASTTPATAAAKPATPPPARHLIFTSSFLAFYSFTGYSPYSPAKAALRSLSDTLSQEMNLYAAAYPSEPAVRVHTVFPAGIQGEAFEAENRIKADVTKLLEEGDEPQAPDALARNAIRALEGGQEIITTDFTTGLVRRSVLGGSIRGGFWRAVGDWLIAGWMALIMIFVRSDMDKKTRDWGRKYGASGMKKET
ncbi:NAD(P)-binding protein [Hypoxylon sp. NC0597]|nr:NAD(P)-binding protein [Hypoxylon sp. NC0597]